jgi:hypothetical protein
LWFSIPFTPFAEKPKRIGMFATVLGVVFVIITKRLTFGNSICIGSEPEAGTDKLPVR